MLLSVMGQQQDLQDMYDDPESAFGPEGVSAGNDALSVIFGSPDVSRAVIDQAQMRAGSLLRRAISWVRFCENLRREFERAASSRLLSAVARTDPHAGRATKSDALRH